MNSLKRCSVTAGNAFLSFLQLVLDTSFGGPKGLLLSVSLYNPGYRGFSLRVRPRQSLLEPERLSEQDPWSAGLHCVPMSCWPSCAPLSS